jgi:hypothetical protein
VAMSRQSRGRTRNQHTTVEQIRRVDPMAADSRAVTQQTPWIRFGCRWAPPDQDDRPSPAWLNLKGSDFSLIIFGKDGLVKVE